MKIDKESEWSSWYHWYGWASASTVDRHTVEVLAGFDLFDWAFGIRLQANPYAKSMGIEVLLGPFYVDLDYLDLGKGKDAC